MGSGWTVNVFVFRLVRKPFFPHEMTLEALGVLVS